MCRTSWWLLNFRNIIICFGINIFMNITCYEDLIEKNLEKLEAKDCFDYVGKAVSSNCFIGDVLDRDTSCTVLNFHYDGLGEILEFTNNRPSEKGVYSGSFLISSRFNSKRRYSVSKPVIEDLLDRDNIPDLAYETLAESVLAYNSKE